MPGDNFVLGLGLRHADFLHVVEALGHWARLAVLPRERELSEFGHYAAVPQALREALLGELNPVEVDDKTTIIIMRPESKPSRPSGLACTPGCRLGSNSSSKRLCTSGRRCSSCRRPRPPPCRSTGSTSRRGSSPLPRVILDSTRPRLRQNPREGGCLWKACHYRMQGTSTGHLCAWRIELTLVGNITNMAIHPVSFISNTVEFRLVLYLKVPRFFTSFVTYFVPYFLENIG